MRVGTLYENLARRGELVALEVQDMEIWPSGTGHAPIGRGKTDAEGREGWLISHERR